MGKITLTATKTGAQQTKQALSGINVQTSKVFVGTADYQENIPEDMVNITIGVFIDGTLNNRSNTKVRQIFDKANDAVKDKKKIKVTPKEKEDLTKFIELKKQEADKKNDDVEEGELKSYDNDQTNLSLLEPFYPEVTSGKSLKTKIYIEGIGTENLGKDDSDGYAYGEGSTGIPKKVEKAIKQVVENVARLLEKNEVEKIHTITFDVFGFSRGAAAARHFISKLSGNLYDSPDDKTRKIITKFNLLGSKLESKEIIQPKFVIAGFAGLFDTVASFGLAHHNDTDDLNLNAVGRAKHVLHLAAQDEHRENFVLTNIDSAGPKGLEIFIPGVHSDIGGSYTDNYEEKDLRITTGHLFKKSANKLRDKLIADSWYHPYEISLDDGNELVINRIIESKAYSYISLHIMAEYANKKKLGLDLSILEEKYHLDYNVGISIKGEDYFTSLRKIKKRLDNYVKGVAPKMDFNNPEDQKMMRAIRLHFMHTSAFYNVKVAAGLYTPHKPHDSYATRKREVNKG